ncbi:DUF7373 family lipoprotein [Gordonia sputi]|uniref:DUF7373 family lipoprotein n=1 Tax=Gordonia sputi TaxID=36823 RepID=UPI00227017F8|nr:hypothetical protein [Gordonia sputi]
MRGNRRGPKTLLASGFATVVLLSGCSVDGNAVSDSDPAANAVIDVKSLDTGKYPTEPRKPFGEATGDEVVTCDAQRMAQYIVAPFEVDADLTDMGLPTQVLYSTTNLRVIVGDDVANVKANDAILYGYVVSAATPDETIRAGTKRELNNFVTRYLTAADATAAANQMADAYLKRPKATTVRPDGMSGSRVISIPGNNDGTDAMVAITAHNTYVLYTYYQTTDAQKDKLAPAIKNAVDLQSALIDQFPATPTKAEREARNQPKKVLMMDQNHVLIYALPYTDQEIKDAKVKTPNPGNVRAVYGPRSMSFFSSDPKTDFRLLNEVGSTANAMDRGTVYRAKTPEGAKKIMDTFENSNRARGMKTVPAPPNLPAARCMSEVTQNITGYWCEVSYGRYVAELVGTDPKDVYQQTAAQYVILTKADQKAN